ncbi:MAG: cobalamin-independent methionine synthase II family protein [Planctomycetaceae bacterium]|mgnify:FL=1|nr:vitamin-B12 independent methionine synthase [Planctomycetota bacterium]NUO16049.1 cobalamin-independent methionine synthase II family protein [Planctomycetaceae bacterium]GIK53783.1 MAG: 5-methyltetrahydropteroyltriglutamate--homocysteine methyltransferase [Planctomycetota bacterium]
MSRLPLFPVTMVGSWPRPAELLRAQKAKRAGKLSAAEFDRLADAAVLEVLRLQDEAGVDVVTDGEQRRDNFYSFAADKLSGVKLMTLAEMLDIIEDKAGFEQILKTLDVPAYSLSNPTCVGRIERKAPLALDELRFLRRHTSKPVKIPLPGPYLLTRAMFVKEASRPTYASKEELSVDVVRVLRAEMADLVRDGADFIQFDEPVLTEVVFSGGKTRTFMCASLAAGGDPKVELEFAVTLMNQVLEGFEQVQTGLHICRGNWSQDESTLLRGNYAPLKPWLERLKVKQLVLEYATERAGDVMRFEGKQLGLGCVNPRTPRVESEEEILAQAQRALEHYEPGQIWLNPDCGFGTFSNSPVNSGNVAAAKMKALAGAARRLRQRHQA